MAKVRKPKARKAANAARKTGLKTRRSAAVKRASSSKSARKAPAKRTAKKAAPKRRAPIRRAAPPAAREQAPARFADLAMPGDDKPIHEGGIREAVASFATETQFRNAVKRLLASGFAPTDLSILTSHDSLEVAGGVPGYTGKPREALRAALTEEAGLLAPLQVAGFSALSGGPVAAAIAALVTAGIGAWGLRDVLDKFAANRHSADYVDALKAGGLLLWVKVTPAQEWKALMILGDSGGSNAHINARAR
ncbi:MAG: hypothetical protein ACREFC_15255 [Stellaceae bacterium]